MCTLAVWALLGYIRPAYARPIHAAPAAGAHLLEVTLSDTDGPLARLIGYQVTPDRALPGGTVDVTLTWQTVRAASNHYVVFVHLLDDLRIIVAQRDTFHGLGNYPTGFWRPDHIFSETYQVILPETAYAPATLSVQVGMYSRERTYRLQPSPATVDNAVALGTVTLDARSADLPNLQDVNFANMIRLVGYRIEPRELEPGDGLLFTLYWQLDHAPDRRIGIILRIVDDYDRTVASYDGMPAWPMAEWPLHVPVEEQRYVAVPENVTTGVYRVEVGAWPEGEANSRLPMIANDGHWIGDRLFLSPIRLGPAQNQ
jgi:hypothetical protein